MNRSLLARHWETVVLLGVAVLCAFSISALDRPSAVTPSVTRNTIAGLTGAGVEKSVLALQPGASSHLTVSSGHRTISFSIDLPNAVHGTITVDSLLTGGGVTSVSCGAYSTPTQPLSTAGSPILHLCANLPAAGAGFDTAGWIDQQFRAASVGYSKLLQHNGIGYDLSYSLYDSTRTHYDIDVLPPLRS